MDQNKNNLKNIIYLSWNEFKYLISDLNIYLETKFLKDNSKDINKIKLKCDDDFIDLSFKKVQNDLIKNDYTEYQFMFLKRLKEKLLEIRNKNNGKK